MSVCKLSPFHLSFSQSGISILWYHIHATHWKSVISWSNVLSGGHHGVLKEGWVAHSMKSVICEGAKIRFSHEFIMGGEDLQSDNEWGGVVLNSCKRDLKDNLSHWGRHAGSAALAILIPTACHSSFFFWSLKSCFFLFSGGCLEGRNKKKFLVWRIPKTELITPSV